MYEAHSIKHEVDRDESTSPTPSIASSNSPPSSTSTLSTTTSPTTLSASPSSASLEIEPSSLIALPYCPVAVSDSSIAPPHVPVEKSEPSDTHHHYTQQDDFPPTKRRKIQVDEMLLSLQSMEPVAQFELWRRMLATHPFNLDQMQTLRTTIESRIKVDIVSRVPYEIASYIMSYLSPRDLCQAGQVCRSWRVVCEDNRLWREKCAEDGLLDDQQILSILMEKRISHRNRIQEKFAADYTSANVPKSQWKTAYLEHIRILRNWQGRAFEIKETFAKSSADRRQGRIPMPQRLDFSRVKQEQSSQSESQSEDLVPLSPEFSRSMANAAGEKLRLMQLRCHEDSVITCLQYNPQTNTIVSGSDDQTLKVWCSETGRCLNTLEGHSGGVWASQLSPDDIVISGATDRTIKVWNAHSGKLIHTLYGHGSTVRCLALNGDRLVSGSRDTTLRLWDINQGSCLNVFCGHSAAVRCVEFKGDKIVSGAYDYLVMVWNATTGLCLHTLEGHANKIYSLQFDGKTIASGSLDSTICVWDADTGKLRHRLLGHTSLTSKMQLEGDILVSANADSFCKIWDVNTGKCLKTLDGPNRHDSAVTSVHFDCRHVVTSSDDGTVKLWDINTGKFIRNLIILPTAGDGGVVWRIRASYTKLICAVGSRNDTDETHLLVLNFDD